jgi:hypothetical protein
MGVTDFRNARDLVMPAGTTFDDTGILHPLNAALLVISAPTTDQELEKWFPILGYHNEDQWVSHMPNGDIQIVEPPAASAVPQIRVNPGLETKVRVRGGDMQKEDQERMERQKLAYIMIVQGKQASTRSKIVTLG